MSSFFVSKSSVRNLKRLAQLRLPGVSSAHLSEALAASMGFNTHAALCSALARSATTQTSRPSNNLLKQRLRAFGYTLHGNDSGPLPDFERSHTPFRTFPLAPRDRPRWRAWRNLMVAAINEGIRIRAFGLGAGADFWIGAEKGDRGSYRFAFQRLPAIASVAAIGDEELSIGVLLNPKDPSTVPDAWSGLDSGDASAHGWLERRLGIWIQDGGEGFHCRRALLAALAEAAVVPSGYADQGSFFM